MTNECRQASPLGQEIFFEITEAAGPNRRALALIALSMANADGGRSMVLSRVLNSLPWKEYQAMLSMLSLKAHAAIHWDEYQMAAFKRWVEES